MWYTIASDSRGDTLSLAGQIDVSTVPELAAALDECRRDVVIDVSAVTFIDSSGINALVGACRRHRAAGTRLSVRGVSKTVREALDQLGLIDYLRVEPEGDSRAK